MISKELLEAVLGDEYKPRLIDIIKMEDNCLCTYYDCGNFNEAGEPTGLGYEINIYELAHKCKEWALKQNFRVEDMNSYGLERGKARLHHTQQMGFCVFGYQRQHTYTSDWFECESIPEAIFAACEWILKELNEIKTN